MGADTTPNKYRREENHMNKAVIIAQLHLNVDKTKSYSNPLPLELEAWYCYPIDAGHSIVCVPKPCFQSGSDLTRWLLPVPVKSVLRGYSVEGEYIVVDYPYDPLMGLLTPPEDDEY